MKKLLSVLLTVLLLLSLAACGGKDGDDASGGSDASNGSNVSGGSSDEDSSGSGSAGDGVYAEDGYAEGRLGDTMHSYFFDFTVNSAYVADTYEGYTPAEGCQVLVVDITVKNTSSSSIEMWDDDFQAQWSDSQVTEQYAWPMTEEHEPASDSQLPDEYELGVNEERSGLLVYDVPTGEKDFSISYLELFDDGTEEGEEGDMFFVFFTAESK